MKRRYLELAGFLLAGALVTIAMMVVCPNPPERNADPIAIITSR